MKPPIFLYLAILLMPSVGAQVIVHDSWADWDRTKTEDPEPLDADWWSSSSTGGNSIEVATESEGDEGDLGLVTGTSGRGIHATFSPQVLAVGDTLVVTSTFKTPDTVGAGKGGAFKIAMMEFNDEDLAADLTSNSNNVNPLYTNLPGYMVDFDVNVPGALENISVREHTTPNETGRFLGTSGEWDSLGSSDDAGYSILPNTAYVAVMSLTRTGEDTMDIFASLSQEGTLLDSHTQTDDSGIANNIGMLGFWANSNTFGSSNSAGSDNGITFSNVTIELNPQPQPGPDIAVFSTKNLGELDVIAATVSDTVTVRNAGSDNALTISGAMFTGADSALFTLEEVPTTVPPNGSVDIKFTFAPNGVVGAFSTTLEIKSDDVDVEDQTVTVEISAGVANLLGPVAHYNLDEAAGTVMTDVTGFGRNGEYDDVTLGQEGLATGGSASFAEGGTASVPGGVLGDPPSRFSVSVWFNGTTFDGQPKTLFGQGPAGTPGYALSASGTELQWFVGDEVEFAGGSITAGTTHHAVVTYASDKATIYLDGVEVASMDSPLELDVVIEDTFFIGSYASALPFSGRIDDVQFYDRALSANDVAALFNSPGTTVRIGDNPEPEPEPTGAGIIVNDSWADFDRSKTEELDADWWSSNSSSGNSIEVATEGEGDESDLGLVTGTSGRGIHATFSPRTLAVGDTLVATATFKTPETVGTDRSTAFKVALMEFNDEGLAADLTSSSADVNALYTDLPGYMADFDVNKADSTENISIREHTTPNETGRFLGTTSEWSALGGSEDPGYKFLSNTEYVVVMSLTRTDEDSMDIFASLSQGGTLLDSHTESDESGIANNIGMLGFWANSNTFGSTNSAGSDNGITFSNVMIEVTERPTADLKIDDSFADADRASTGALDADWWSSSSTGGNSVEVEAGALGLVTGTSGRGIHGTFAPESLEIGEALVTTLTFTTPVTVGTDKGGALKFALMEFNDPGLAADLSSSSNSVNPLYTNLPGYMIDLDVNTGEEADLTIREHTTPNETGRFLGTTGEWASLGSSADAGYAFAAETEYVVEISVTRTGEDSMTIFASLSQDGVVLASHSETDDSGIANNFGMLGVWANSNTFGSTNGADPDNGITISNVTVGLIATPSEPEGVDSVITSIDYDGGAGSVMIEWTAEMGVGYLVFGSENLTAWEEIGDVTAEAVTASFTEVGVTARRRYYRVETVEE